jgi:hypothetical protein
VVAITLALAAASLSTMSAMTSRDHGQRPMLSRLALSIAITAILSEGARDAAATPMS